VVCIKPILAKKLHMQHWAFHVALAIDQLVNALLGGYADESLSARAYRRRSEPLWRLLVRLLDWMFFWHAAHCEGAYWAEKKGRHLPKEYRE
jgi:hypothetical protein